MMNERLKDIREERGLLQKDLANIFQISRKSYSRWETGEITIPLTHLNTLCNYFNLSMDYVICLTRKNTGSGRHELDAKKIGSRLKELRKQNNLSQMDLANFLNTTQSTISAYESGKTTILTSFALQIVKKYKISLDWLCGRSNQEKK